MHSIPFARSLAGAVLLALIGPLFLLAAEPNERARKVREDREKVIRDGFWIYGDLPRAFQEAKSSGKPILVVLRCLPCTECVKLDDEVVDQDPELKPLLEKFVCVRVVSTNGLDLSLFQFDTDQSFAAFILRDEKTIYGRFGTRSHRTDWLGDVSVKGLAEALRGALEIHQSWPRDQEVLTAKIGPRPQIMRPELFPSLSSKFAYQSTIDYEGDVVRSCIHCHQIGDAIRDELRAKGLPLSDQLLFPYPHPKSVGLVLNPDSRATIKAIDAETPAAKSGLLVGDKITRINQQPILSMADVQWILHQTAAEGGRLTVEVDRVGTLQQLALDLPNGWRRKDDISWRVSAWGLARMALGGMRLEPLSDQQRTALQLVEGQMALRVRSVGQYGAHATAKKAGVRVDDVVIAIDDYTNLMNESDVIRYGTQEKLNGSIRLTALRDGKTVSIALPLQN